MFIRLCALCTLLVVGRAAAQTPDRFANLSEIQLDSLYGPLIYLMRTEERGIYPGLSLAGKREFLRHFWAQRNPAPGSPANAAEVTFRKRLGEGNQKFHVVGGAGAGEVPGWRTDRGRVYLEVGPPDIVLNRRDPGPSRPFEVWKYTRGKFRKYCFVDLTRFGNYVLVYSSDPHEARRPEWRDLLDDDAYADIVRF